MDRDNKPTEISIAGAPMDDDRVAAVYRCHQALEALRETDQPDVKYCDACAQRVFRVQDFKGLERAIASRACVWGVEMASSVPRPDAYYLGGPALGYSPSLLSWDD